MLQPDAASAGGFYGVHAFVCDAEDGVDGFSVCGEGGQADAGADGDFEAGAHAEDGRGEVVVQAGGVFHSLFARGFWH
uniref:Uncharacterized protein n=1 Tax=mine drainage metagenome TaxID=410659 RepID=E6PWY8_9ZZZZ